MPKLNLWQIKNYNAEQIAGILLSFLQDFERKLSNPSYYGASLRDILGFEIAPVWLGKRVENGLLIGDGYVSTYGGDRPTPQLESLFTDAEKLLWKHELIRQDPTQSSSNFVLLTDAGLSMQVREDFSLRIQRRAQDITSMYRDSVFLMETRAGGDFACGTCFLLPTGDLLTCKHNVEDKEFTIHFSSDTQLDKGQFEVVEHKDRDLAVLRFRSKMFKDMLKDRKPLELGFGGHLQQSDELITMGYPKVALRMPELLVTTGVFQGFTTGYYKDQYVTFSNKIDGGYSGGPVISLYGQVVAVITESTEQASDSGGQGQASGTHYHGTPIEDAALLL